MISVCVFIFCLFYCRQGGGASRVVEESDSDLDSGIVPPPGEV